MTLDIPEVLIIILTAMLVWLATNDWVHRHRGPHE
jgi:hypothetical protein